LLPKPQNPILLIIIIKYENVKDSFNLQIALTRKCFEARWPLGFGENRDGVHYLITIPDYFYMT